MDGCVEEALGYIKRVGDISVLICAADELE